MSEWSNIFRRLRETGVSRNFSFMTVLNISGAVISFLLYPYLIRVLGAEQMGLYAFLFSIASYFQIIVAFGFHLPAVKAVSLNSDNPKELDRIVSMICSAKMLMFILSSFILALFIFIVPVMRDNAALLTVIFLQSLDTCLFPLWYYQGMKNMKAVTIIQLSVRLTQIPLIFIFVRSRDNLMEYSAIVTVTMVLGAVWSVFDLYRKGRRWAPFTFAQLRELFKDSSSFFLTSLAATVKEKIGATLIGSYLGMKDVAVYDLATKIIQIPRIVFNNINKALFPEVVLNPSYRRVRSILRLERWIGVAALVTLSLLAYPAVLILGGQDMMAAVPVVIVLSSTIYASLISNVFIQFEFVPSGKYMYVFYNQIVASVVCVLLSFAAVRCCPSPIMVATAIVLSGFVEILFCRRMSRLNESPNCEIIPYSQK